MVNHSASLSINQKIGQLFFIGIGAAEIDDKARSLLEEIAPGGVCLFSRNIKSRSQVRLLLDEIRVVSIVEPLLSIDQEGGTVDRLRRILTPMPAAALINSAANVERAARFAAEALRMLGFNMNFAPVADVSGEERGTSSNGLYSRAFGKTAAETAQLSGAYLRFLQENGCLGCLKHFPGLGASAVDSHEELPILSVSETDFSAVDLHPFREIINSGQAFAVMIAHAGFPETNWQETDARGKMLPSSLSYNLTTKLLRETLHFTGVAITDDLEMGAIIKNYGIGEACKMALLAGADMLAVCADPTAVRTGFDAVCRAVENGEISETRIDESLARIAHLKSLVKPPLPFSEARLEDISKEIAEFNKTLTFGG